jgi:MSHA biogenesis protein MshJ
MKMLLSKKLEGVQNRIDEFSLRERAILFLAISLVLFLLVNKLLLTPLETQQKQLLDRTRALHTEIAALDQQTVATVEASRHDPNTEQRQQLAQLQQRHAQLQQQILDSLSGLVEPQQMSRALEQLLHEQKALRFVRIENLEPQPIMSAEGKTDSMVYRHTLVMEMEGDFRSALAYLQTLEQLEWQFRWDEVSLNMISYPRAQVIFKVHTLSMQRGWLGV